MSNYKERGIEQLEAELEAIKAKNALLRQERDSARSQLAEAKRKIERLQMEEDAFAGGAMQRYREGVNRIQIERDRYRDAIIGFCRIVDDLFNNHPSRKKVIEILERYSQMENKPHLVTAILNAGHYVEKRAVEINNAFVEFLQQNQLATYNPVTHPEIALQDTLNKIFSSTVQEILANQAQYAYGFSNDIPVVADQIIRECRIGDKEPKLKTINKLSKEWIKVAQLPQKPITLANGLKWAQRYRDSEKTMADFIAECQLNNEGPLNERSLRNYIYWYETLENAGKDQIILND